MPPIVAAVLKNRVTRHFYVALMQDGMRTPQCKAEFGPVYLTEAEARKAAGVVARDGRHLLSEDVIEFGGWYDITRPPPSPAAKPRKGKKR